MLVNSKILLLQIQQLYNISTYPHMKSKAQKKKADKVIEDRTFGLKNKNKSKVVQKFCKGVEQTVKNGNVTMSKLESEQFQKRKRLKKEEQEKALLNSLYNDVNRLKQNDDSQEEDPANIVCPYFKQGLCQKGKKCIYSHDLTMDRTEQIDLYVDQRTQLIMNALGGKELSSISQEQLGKHIGEKEKEMIKGFKSDIICKFFLEAVEKDKYGWNWNCPNNGDRCKYKHCLPPGYRLKKDAGKLQVQQNVDIEAKIDEERNKLFSQNRSSPLVTYEVFLKWKEDRRIRKQSQVAKKKQQQEKKNKTRGPLRTGRQLFQQNPNLFVDDQEAADQYEQEEIVEQPQEEQKQERLYDENEEGEEEEPDLQKPQKKEETHQELQHHQQ